jgi:formylglycine-generating enzyme required for sulfatase activity
MMTLSGMRQLVPDEPVCHASYYEADAYARWAGARLPGEAEWEVAAAAAPIDGNFAEDGHFHPIPAHRSSTEVTETHGGHRADRIVDRASAPPPNSDSVASVVGLRALRATSEAVPNPQSTIRNPQLSQLFGDVWEWTGSAYSPYPGYHPLEGALGEYNGKFMCSQIILRGGSCATSRSHIRPTYRNFFPPNARWQFSGIRLARDAG